MRRVFLMAAFLGLAGCQGIEGPFQRASRPIPIDDPRLPLDEQEARGRERLAYPDDSEPVGPRTFTEPPAVGGRY